MSDQRITDLLQAPGDVVDKLPAIRGYLRQSHMAIALHAAANPYLSGYSPESHCSVCKHSKHPPSGARTPGDLECRLSGLQRVQMVFLKLRQANGFINDGTVRCEFEKE